MFSITSRQLGALSELAFLKYQQGLLARMRKHFPRLAKYLGPQDAHQLVQHACDVAEQHGFETERDICSYTDLIIMLGVGFDSDPQLEWGAAVLGDPTPMGPGTRMDELWDQAAIYMDKTLGPDEICLKRAFVMDRRRRQSSGKAFATREELLIDYFREIWPAKTEYIGMAALRSLITESTKAAKGYWITDSEGQTEFAIHAFLFGHMFHIDPRYLNVNKALKSGQSSHSYASIPQVVAAFDEYANQVLL
ncbi:MAG TPA: hypothetical protein VK539_31850 [Myxococcaceae bacterium]|nr:hypothetical protein [Myxococcaceae bacterium]